MALLSAPALFVRQFFQFEFKIVWRADAKERATFPSMNLSPTLDGRESQPSLQGFDDNAELFGEAVLSIFKERPRLSQEINRSVAISSSTALISFET
jgi:hypothetical protein